MLSPETPFPYPGSYALIIDMDQPPPQGHELVRVMWRREGHVAISFPLRTNAGGNKVVAEIDLIDPTPLTHTEERELAELQHRLEGRTRLTPKQKIAAARRDALRSRLIAARAIIDPLRQARWIAAKQRRAA